MPTARQTGWYWREWAAVVRVCQAAGHPPPDRHGLHVRALGRDKSMLDLTNDELDLVIAEFRAISHPDDLDLQMIPEQQRRIRKLHKMQELLRQLAEALRPGCSQAVQMIGAWGYLRAILRDKYHASAPDDLTDAQLRLLLIDLTRAAESLRRRRGVSA
jgi:hypothetical protein